MATRPYAALANVVNLFGSNMTACCYAADEEAVATINVLLHHVGLIGIEGTTLSAEVRTLVGLHHIEVQIPILPVSVVGSATM